MNPNMNHPVFSSTYLNLYLDFVGLFFFGIARQLFPKYESATGYLFNSGIDTRNLEAASSPTAKLSDLKSMTQITVTMMKLLGFAWRSSFSHPSTLPRQTAPASSYVRSLLLPSFLPSKSRKPKGVSEVYSLMVSLVWRGGGRK